MKKILLALIGLCALACNDMQANAAENGAATPVEQQKGKEGKHYRGAFSNGMKGDSLSFDVSADGKTISNILFKGYWRCGGRLEIMRAAGPEGSFDIVNGKADVRVAEPPDGGSTAWVFDLHALIDGDQASGTFRMNINNLGCDTYLLKFEAAAQ